MVVSPAYPVSFVWGILRRGKSESYRLNEAGEISPPCGTPIL